MLHHCGSALFGGQGRRVVCMHARCNLSLCVAAGHRLELRRGVAVSLSQMERRLLLVYCAWELTNIFLGGVLSGSLVR